jgi:hypothetical protein
MSNIQEALYNRVLVSYGDDVYAMSRQKFIEYLRVCRQTGHYDPTAYGYYVGKMPIIPADKFSIVAIAKLLAIALTETSISKIRKYIETLYKA